jgi:hypothetical protein
MKGETWRGGKQAPSSLKYQMRRDFDALTDRILRHPVVNKRMEILKIKDLQIPLKINRISIWETRKQTLAQALNLNKRTRIFKQIAFSIKKHKTKQIPFDWSIQKPSIQWPLF